MEAQTPQAKRQVTLLQRRQGKLGAGLGKTTGWIHRKSLEKFGVKTMDSVKYKKSEGKKEFFEKLKKENLPFPFLS